MENTKIAIVRKCLVQALEIFVDTFDTAFKMMGVHERWSKRIPSIITRETFLGWDRRGTIKIAVENTKFAIVRKSEIVDSFGNISSAMPYQ